MVDVSQKPTITREAIAKGQIKLKQDTVKLIKEGRISKGNLFSLAKTAAILAAKKTSEIIPLCHPLPLSAVEIQIQEEADYTFSVEARIKAFSKTGVEMEALTAVSVALLTIWDMTKQYEKDNRGQYPTTKITDIQVLRKVKTGE